MPKEEAPVPWGVTNADARQLYPRKNIYFVGAGGEEVYNYCVWQAHINGHVTLESKKARGVSAFILDILTRRYFEAMLDPEKFLAFTNWATADYGSDVVLRRPQPLLLAVKKMLRSLPKRSELPGTLKQWELSSKVYQDLHHFCSTFNEIFGPMFEDADDAEQAS